MAYNPTWTISLTTLIKSNFDNKTLQKEIAKKVEKPAFRKMLGSAIVEEIIERTQNKNIDKNGKSFPGYSNSYKKSLSFEIYGKSASDINLTLTGEMIASMTSKSNSEEMIIFLKGQNNKDKAEGHVSGIYGKSKTRKKRDFLGLPNDVLNKVFKDTLKKFNSDERGELSTSLEINGQEIDLTIDAGEL